jgi:phenol 2-monooxygenase
VQFYLDGYRPGDPFVAPSHDEAHASAGEVPREVDVLIVGSGPAGLVLAAQLAAFPQIHTVVVEQADGPLLVGQADGVACRTMEILEAFGLADRVMAEAYWVNEVSFWSPDPGDPTRIVRTGCVRDTDESVSELPHVTVNQARLLAHLLNYMERSPSRLRPLYGLQATEVRVESSPLSTHPVAVTLHHLQGLRDTGQRSVVRARYVVGCDGAHSSVRRSIGRELVGDTTDAAWGVMDLLAVTDFPDIRRKSVIRSSEGSVLVIPREGGYLVRIYVELDALPATAGSRSTITADRLVAVTNRILRPYTLEAKEVGWWSVYEIGQRLTERFDDLPKETLGSDRTPRVFIAGDACHTHSAKAGQGMNVSIADAWNLGWKLAAVLQGQARQELLCTYSEERHNVARELIEFDRVFAAAMSGRPKSGRGDVVHPNKLDQKRYERYFAEQLPYTAGTATCYGPSMITGRSVNQQLAKGFPVGSRFHSAPVIRLADARRVQLGHVARADGAWRLYVFADHLPSPGTSSRWRKLCDVLESQYSVLRRFTPPGADPDAVIDVRAIFQQSHQEMSIASLPRVLLPRKGRYGLVDYEKAFCAIPGKSNIFDLREIDRDTGCMVLVRPDQYVSHVLPLDAHEELVKFFSGFLLEQRRQAS